MADTIIVERESIMGEYYNWVNVDKKEYICPGDFGYGSKSMESSAKDGVVMRALREMLFCEWKGDRILWVGDECDIPENTAPELFDLLRKHSEELGYYNNIFDTIYESYTNVSCLFKDAEECVRREIMYYIEEWREGNSDVINEYGIWPDNPYEGLFKREGRDFKYTVNYTKNICYCFDQTKVLYADGSVCSYNDPLSQLMGYGSVLEPGGWLGDIIGVTDEIDDSIRILDTITLAW